MDEEHFTASKWAISTMSRRTMVKELVIDTILALTDTRVANCPLLASAVADDLCWHVIETMRIKLEKFKVAH